MELYERLAQGVSLISDDAAIVITVRLTPVGGSSARLFPPTYPVDAVRADERRLPYVVEPRLVGDEVVETVLLDSVQSEANRVEEALEQAAMDGRVRLPYLLLEHELPTGRTIKVTSFTAPHRYADAYFRDSMLDGQVFDKTEIGRSLRAVTAEDARVLFEREPLSLLLGAWDSHRKGARPARFARVYRSEIFGTHPEFGVRAAGRMDPHNITKEGAAVLNTDRARDGSGQWEYTVTEKPVAKASRPSEVGHGNIAPTPAHGGATVRDVVRLGSISMAGLARLRFGDAPTAAAQAARVTLAALGLAGDRLAFGAPSLFLRSGCELVIVEETLAWQRRGGELEEFNLSPDDALALFEEARDRAAAAGLPMSDEVVKLTAGPNNLAKALDHAYLTAAAEES